MSVITRISGVEILDSRNKPTLSVRVETNAGVGECSVPSGASTGSREAKELRDASGSVAPALAVIEEVIDPALRGLSVDDQRAIDDRLLSLDGSANKEVLGGNTLIGVSIAAAYAAAAGHEVPLFEHLRSLASIKPSRTIPYLYLNYINGGKHAISPLAFQEHLIVPKADTVDEALEIAQRIEQSLNICIREHFGDASANSRGDEGGFVIPDGNPEAPFDLLREASERAALLHRVSFALDAAATSIWKDGAYEVDGRSRSSEELCDFYVALAAKYPILSIEDPFEENDRASFAKLQKAIPQVRIVGDDLTVTATQAIREAAADGAIRAVIIKPNQIGTLTETLDAMRIAREDDIDCIVSHRSGETMATFVADLAYAFGTFGLKAGALRRDERVVKYERLRAISHL